MAVMAVIIITGGVMVMVITVVAVAVVMAPGKGSGKNPVKSSPRRKKGIPLGVPDIKGSINGGNKRTPRYLARLKKITKYKIRGGLPITGKRGPRADREKGRPKERGPAGGIIG